MNVNDPNRLLADLRASEAADAIGLSYRHSRITLWRILREGKTEPPASEYLQKCFEHGRWAEKFADSTYQDRILRTQKGFTLFRQLDKFLIAASPDAFSIKGVVEYKSKMRGSPMPEQPKAEHVIQVVVQMWAAHSLCGDLFYHNVWTGEYRCFHLRWNELAWDMEVKEWLLEFLNKPPSRMINGEAQRRATSLLNNFWAPDDTSSTTKDIRPLGPN